MKVRWNIKDFGTVVALRFANYVFSASHETPRFDYPQIVQLHQWRMGRSLFAARENSLAARELAASPKKVSRAHPLPPATQAKWKWRLVPSYIFPRMWHPFYYTTFWSVTNVAWQWINFQFVCFFSGSGGRWKSANELVTYLSNHRKKNINKINQSVLQTWSLMREHAKDYHENIKFRDKNSLVPLRTFLSWLLRHFSTEMKNSGTFLMGQVVQKCPWKVSLNS